MNFMKSVFSAFRFEARRKFRRSLKHNCELPDTSADLMVQFIVSGYFVGLRRRFKSWMVCDDKNIRSKMYLRSSEAIHLEKLKHLQLYYHMIHPFSKMRLLWEQLMLIVLAAVFIYTPLDVCFWQQMSVTNKIPRLFMDFMCIVDICLTFITGYMDPTTNKIIMKPRTVAIRYLTRRFVLDLISSINADAVIMLLPDKDKDSPIFMIPSFLKIFRLATYLTYMERYREWRQYSPYKAKLVRLGSLLILAMIWSTCLLYLIAREMREVWMPENKIQGQTTVSEAWEGLRLCLIRIIMNFVLVAQGESNSERLEVIALEVAWMTIGWVIKLTLTAQVIQVVMKYSTLSDKYYQMVQQFEEYMRAKSLPEAVQRRVLAYFEFRFQGSYYREKDILDSLSNQLKQEIIVHTCGSLLRNSILFSDIPQPLLARVSYSMKMEIYLPNDVVFSAGADANTMYFILTGMAAVYDRYGKEVCHMADGSYFGEMCLFLTNQKRTASVVSIDFCEMYTLNKKDFLDAVAAYPDVYDKIENLAKQRLKEFLMEEEEAQFKNKTNLPPPSRIKIYYNI